MFLKCMTISLDFSRIVLFSVSVFVTRFIVGFFYGVVFFEDVCLASVYYIFLNFLILPVATMVIFMVLGIKQERNLYVSAFLIVVLSEVLEVVVSFLFSGEWVVFPLVLLEYCVYVISVFVGVRVGERIGRGDASRNSRG